MTDEQAPRNRWRDLWTLHIPLILVLALCTTATVIEFRRANEGVWRAWVYLFEWPLIAAFAIWMWVRFRRESGGGFVRRWRERVERAAREGEEVDAEPDADADADADVDAEPDADPHVDVHGADPQLEAWRAYQRRVRDADEADAASDGAPPPGTADPRPSGS